jgi:hypothetical protein
LDLAKHAYADCYFREVIAASSCTHESAICPTLADQQLDVIAMARSDRL